ncbi:HopJ type III effector protein [Zhongshania borealis]|uniref:HopJ type III effector protein n=1 Tax=Zhongshania borealis TaxID=889488 RepID=A0ABP7X774_9GAMM
MVIQEFIDRLARQSVAFTDVMAFIDEHYSFTPTAFQNGEQFNDAGSNNGSCKVFAFGALHQLSVQATLHAFGDYYTNDVLANPHGDDHANIRNFMRSGWGVIRFEGDALMAK